MVNAKRQSLQMRDSQTHKRRSSGVNLARFPAERPQHADLVPQSQVLQLQGSARTQDRRQSGKQCRKKIEHRERETKEL
jgi:hypothetical protein